MRLGIPALFIIAFFLFQGSVAQQGSQPVLEAATSEAETSQVDQKLLQIQQELKTVRKMVEIGDYVKAQRGYETLLKKVDLPEELRGLVYEEYATVNRNLLYSRIATSSSTMHSVVSGDSLYKIAKKYKTTVNLIKKSNALQNDTIYPDTELKVVTGTFSIKIDISENKLYLFLDDKPIQSYRVATGKDNSTPAGEFVIVNKLKDPTWYKTGAVIPPDSPENQLGTRWLGFDHAGYGIHGTIEPESIGNSVSAGCIRMLNNEVEEIYNMVPVGTKVKVVH